MNAIVNVVVNVCPHSMSFWVLNDVWLFLETSIGFCHRK